MCGHFYQVAVHLIRERILHLQRSLIDSCQHSTSDSRLDGCAFSRVVVRRLNPFLRQCLYRRTDCRVVVKCSGGNLHPGTVENLYKDSRGFSRRRTGEIFKNVLRLPHPCGQRLLQIFGSIQRLRFLSCRPIRFPIRRQCLVGCQEKQGFQFFCTLACKLCQALIDIFFRSAHFFQHLLLMLRCRNPIIISTDSSRHVHEDIPLRLRIELY